MPEITLSSGAQFHAEPGVSLLEAAFKADIALPYSCKTGRCSTCKCISKNGTSAALQPEDGLTEAEKAQGWILSCVRTATSDLTLEVENLVGFALPSARIFPCRIHSLNKLAPDVIRVELRLPANAGFHYLPGQYIETIRTDHDGTRITRSYSLANLVYSGSLLELHIRAVPHGVMSDYWFARASVNDLLRLNGPFGTFFLRDIAGFDLIFLATGTGIAPLQAMLGAIAKLAAGQQPKSVTLLWGGRNESDLYLDMSTVPIALRFIPVLSRATQNWTGARGYVQDVLLGLEPELGNAAIYACGSDAMIHSARHALLQAGLPPQRFFSDTFVCSAQPFKES